MRQQSISIGALVLLWGIAGCQRDAPVEPQAVDENPTSVSLIEVGRFAPNDPGLFNDMVVSNGEVFLVTDPTVSGSGPGSGLYIVGIETPSSPRLKSFVHVDGANSVAVANGYAYVGTDKELTVIDVRNSASPRIVGGVNQLGIDDISVRGTYAFLKVSEGLIVVDVGDPALPARCGATLIGEGEQTIAMAISGNLVTLTTGGALYGLYFYDISSPRLPVQVARFTREALPSSLELDPPFYGYNSGAYKPYLSPVFSNDRLVISTYQGFFVYDVASPTAPRLLFEAMTPQIDPNVTTVQRGLIVSEVFDYSAWPGKNALKILDQWDSAHPRQVGSADVGTNVRNIQASGDFVFVISAGKALQIFRMD